MSDLHIIFLTCLGLLLTTYWLVVSMQGILSGNNSRICLGVAMMLMTTAATVAAVLL
jgi:hypothetical protein